MTVSTLPQPQDLAKAAAGRLHEKFVFLAAKA